MDEIETKTAERPGLPLTFGGVAAYSRAGLSQCVFRFAAWAAVCAVLWVWSIDRAWLPAVELALGKLPERASFHAGRLAWHTPHPIVLANDHFLSLIVNPGDEATVDRTADIQIELGSLEVRCRSFLGWIYLPFPATLEGDFGRDTALPWWGAWKPSLLAVLALMIGFTMLLSWIVVGTLCTGPALMIARILGKPATVPQVWRTCVAALLPGEGLVTLAVVSYACNRISMLLLLVFWAGHWLVGWIYLIGGISSFAKGPTPPKVVTGSNPFDKTGGYSPDGTGKNPFRTPPEPDKH